jgi:hypothetical protein
LKVDWAASAVTRRATLRACGGAAGGVLDAASTDGSGTDTAVAGDSGVTDGRYCSGGTCDGAAALAVTVGVGNGLASSDAGKVGAATSRPGGVATGGVATGTCVNVSVLTVGMPAESLTDGSNGESFETQNRPWQRGQFA